jgi:hypothetical protein
MIPKCWIANLRKRRVTIPLVRVFDAHSAAGRPARKTNGLVAAAMSGTRSTREAYARLVSINGLKLNVFRALAGRRIPIGMRSANRFHVDSWEPEIGAVVTLLSTQEMTRWAPARSCL